MGETKMLGQPTYTGGQNIALKLPPHEFEATLRFYRDTLGFHVDEKGASPVVAFGPMKLWLDRVDTISQAEIWLEITTDNVEMAAEDLSNKDVVRQNEIEKLPSELEGFWISSPANIIHLVAATDE